MFGKKWRLFRAHYRAYSSQAYKDIMHAADHLASKTLAVIDSKPQEERVQIFDKSSALVEKVMDTTTEDSPLVVALALLRAVHVYEQMVHKRAEEIRAERQ